MKSLRKTASVKSRSKSSRLKMEELERRELLSISQISEQLVGQYGEALFGADWESQSGLTTAEVKAAFDDDSWHETMIGHTNAFVADFRSLAQSAGQNITQSWFDAKLQTAGLDKLRVAHFDWFEDEPTTDASELVGPIAMPMATGIQIYGSSGPATDGGEGGYIEIKTIDPSTGQQATVGTYDENGDAFATFVVTWHADRGSSFYMDFTTVDGTAESGSDYELTSGRIHFSSGAVGGSVKVDVPLFNNMHQDTPGEIENFFLQLGTPTLQPGADDEEGFPSSGGISEAQLLGSTKTNHDYRPLRDSGTGLPSAVGFLGAPTAAALVAPSNNPNSECDDGDEPSSDDSGDNCGCGTKTENTRESESTGGQSGTSTDNIDDRTGSHGCNCDCDGDGDGDGDGVNSDLWLLEGNNWFDAAFVLGEMQNESAANYHSETNQNPILIGETRVPYVGGDLVAYSAEVTLTFNGTALPPVHYSDPNGIDQTANVRFLQQIDVSALPTGTYEWSMTIVFNYGEPAASPPVITNQSTKVLRGEVSVVNRTNSPYGSNWWINSLDRLFPQGQDVTWVTGDGYALFFKYDAATQSFRTPPGTLDVLKHNPDNTYTITSPRGEQKHFSATGELLSTIDSLGNALTYTYTPFGAVASITDQLYRSVVYSYDSNEKLASVTNPSQQTTVVQVDNGRLSTISGPSVTTVFEYNGPNNKLSEVDKDDKVTKFFYDSIAGRLSAIEYPNQATRYISPVQTQGLFDASSGVGTTGNPAPFLTQFDSSAVLTDPRSNQTTNVYNGFGQILSSTNASGTTTYERNEGGQITKIVRPDPDGSGPLGTRTTIYTYDVYGNLIRADYPDNTFEEWEYVRAVIISGSPTEPYTRIPTKHIDTMGQITFYELDLITDAVRVITRVVGELDSPENEETDDIVTQYTYTPVPDTPVYFGGDYTWYSLPAGLVTSVIDSLGRTTIYSYHKSSSGVVGMLSGISYYEGPPETTYDTVEAVDRSYEIDIVTKQLTSMVQSDEEGRYTRYVYDSQGQVESVTSGLVSPFDETGLTTSYVYGDGGLTMITRPRGDVTEYVYDELGRLSATHFEDPDDDGPLEAPVETIHYNEFGEVEKTIDALNRVTRYVYDAEGRLWKKILPDPDFDPEVDGPITTYSYYPSGQLHTEEDSRGAITTYEYDIMGRLVKTTLPDPDGEPGPLVSPVITRAYDDLGRLESITDAIERQVVYTYDSLSRLVRTTLPDDDGLISEFSPYTEIGYDKVGNVTSRRDLMGYVTTYEYDFRNRLTKVVLPDPAGTSSPGPTTTTTYWKDGRLKSTVDPLERVESRIYDAFGRLSTVALTSEDETLSVEMEMTYDDNGNLETITDAMGNVTKYEYDYLNRIVATILPHPDNGTPTGPTTRTFYDAVGQVTSTLDARLAETAYEYDGLGRPKRITLPDPDGPGPLGRPYSEVAYDSNGNVTSQVDAMISTTAFEYDFLNRRIKTTLPNPIDGTATGPTLEATYDAAGQLEFSKDQLQNLTQYVYDWHGRVSMIAMPSPDGIEAGPFLEFYYDANGNVTSQSDERGFFTTYIYDALNRRIETILPLVTSPSTSVAYNSIGQVLTFTDAMQRVTTNKYDGLGRLEKTTSPDPDDDGPLLASAVEYIYDDNGNVRFIKDSLDQTTERRYDHLNRLVRVIEPPSLIGASESVTKYGYDASSNRVSLIDPNENETTWEYDFLGRVIVETDPLTNSRTYRYDALDRLAQITDRLGRDIKYSYDFQGRRTKEEWFDGATSEWTMDYGYDDAGRMTTASDPSASYVFSYDDLNRLTQYETTLPGLASNVTLYNAYDSSWDRTRLLATIGATNDFVNDYVYDAMGQITAVKQHTNPIIAGNSVADKYVAFAYNDDGSFASQSRYKNLSGTQAIGASDFAYDLAGRLTGINSPIANHSWVYDVNHRIVSYTNSIDGTQAFNYDHQNQLLGVDAVTQTYDPAGNRNDHAVSDGNQVTGDGTYTYGYDLEGNMVRRSEIATGNVRTFEYDYRNRLVDVVDYLGDEITGVAVQSVIYAYDTLNRRVARSIDVDGDGDIDRDERFVYDGDNVVLDFVDADGDGTAASMGLARRYLFGPAVDQILAQENTDELLGAPERVLWFFADNQGTTRDLADNSGAIASHYTYAGFGEPLSGDLALSRYLYTAREYDVATDLQYNRNRWFDPGLARWITQDPIGFGGGDANLYRYVGNAPTVAIDPTGEVVVLIHGVNTNAAWYARANQGLHAYWQATGQKEQAIIHFEWGDPNSSQGRWQGGRPNYATDTVAGMYDPSLFDRSYMLHAMGRLINILDRFEEANAACQNKEPVTVIAHSQGSVITVGALQHAATVDNLILMGSPLDVWSGNEVGPNNDLAVVKTQIRGKTFNYWSSSDVWATQKGGIGAHGAPMGWITNRRFASGQIHHGYTLPTYAFGYGHSDYMATAQFFERIYGPDVAQAHHLTLTNNQSLMAEVSAIAVNW